jgi:hypothetical protein
MQEEYAACILPLTPVPCPGGYGGTSRFDERPSSEDWAPPLSGFAGRDPTGTR